MKSINRIVVCTEVESAKLKPLKKLGARDLKRVTGGGIGTSPLKPRQ